MTVTRVLLLLLALGPATACARASDEAAAKRAPASPPPNAVEFPAGLTISVAVDGAAAPPITAASLAAVEPDFQDDERRAWRLARILPGFDRAGRVVEARGATGPGVRIDHPAAAGDLEPVLVLTRRGEVGVSVIDPKTPFPPYHGQGGQLRRGGDPLPRLAGVRALRVEGGAVATP